MKAEDKALLLRLLDYAGVRRDAESYAERLIERFLTFPDILRAEVGELMDAGLPESAAIFLNMLLPTVRCCKERALRSERPTCNNAELIGQICSDLLRHHREERVCALLLDEKMRLIDIVWLSTGTISSAMIPVSELARAALKSNAYYIVLAHNHPDGTAEPSDADKFVTEELRHNLSGMGITLLEHFIVSDDSYHPLLLHTVREVLAPESVTAQDFYSVAMRRSAGLAD